MSDNKMFDQLENLNDNSSTDKLWKGTFREFLKRYEETCDINKSMGALAHQRVYSMILAAGVEKVDHFGKERTRYAFFEESLYGMEDSIDEIMSYLHSAAQRTETSKRMLLLFGPVSSGKSDAAMHLKRGLEAFTRTPQGAVYALTGTKMHENPFLLIPESLRPSFESQYGIQIEGQLSPYAAWRLKDEFKGKFMEYPVEQVFFDEDQRIGIGTFLPSDPKTLSTDTTLVFTENGIERLSNIFAEAELDQEGFSSLQFNAAAFEEDEEIKGIYDHGILPMYLADFGGIWVDCTQKHKFMTLNEDGTCAWRALKDITLDTPVVVKAGMNKFGKDNLLSNFSNQEISMNPEIAEIVGGLIAESSYGEKKSPTFFYHNTSSKLVKRFNIFVKNQFGIEPTLSYRRVSVQVGNVLTETKKLIGCSLKKTLSNWLEYQFEMAVGACEKQVPNVILQSSKESYFAFLEGLFLGDASIGYRINKKTKTNTARFAYGTCSLRLAMDVQSMLLNIGILTHIEQGRNKKYPRNIQYKVICEGYGVYEVANLFPLFSHDRQFDESLKVAKHGPQDEFFGSLCPFIQEIRKYTKGTRYFIDGRYCIETENNRTPTRPTLESWKQQLNQVEWTDQDKKIELLGRLDAILSFRMVRMRKKTYLGMKHGVDLSCKSTKFSFVANGLVSHNSQDQAELVGSIDFAKIQEFGDEADPRAYNFNGELNVANRGMVELIEILKSDERLLRVLLTVTQEKSIKAPRFGLIYCDLFLLLHTNEEEFKNFMAEKKYEAYHDRMIIVKVPYNLGMSNEIKIYEKLLKNSEALRGFHIAPKTLNAAAMFAVLTRLSPPPDQGDLTLIKKMRLYDKQHVRGYKVEQVPTMKKRNPSEGMTGISPRFVIDQISASISTAHDEGRDYITALDVLRQLNNGIRLRDSFSQERKNYYETLIESTRQEWNLLLKNDIQKAFFVCYEDEARSLCENYFDQIEASCAGQKPRDPVTGEETELDEKLMNSIEEQIQISQSGREDFRNEILRAVGSASRKGKKFDYTEHAQLREAIQKKLFEERKNVIRMTVSSRNPDVEELRRINEVIDRMVEQQGYSVAAANALLKYASSHLFDK
mgnify:FL=1